MNCLPNLFIPGAAKSGTSSLHEYLNQHPDINMSKKKEPHFFCDNRSDDEWKEYLDMFDDKYVYNGESSTGYMLFNSVINRIEEKITGAKFIFLLRNPIDRIISHYNWLEGIAAEDKTLLDAIKYDFDTEPNYHIHPVGPGYKNYYHWGLYYKYLKQFYKKIPAKQILIITTESLKNNPENTLNKCTDFLQLNRYEFDVSKKSNASVSVQHKRLYFFVNYVLSSNKLVQKSYQLLPESLKNRIKDIKRKKVDTLVTASTAFEDKEKMNIRVELKKYYLEDVENLKNLLKYKFPEWKDFN
jgi:hypothetical protein